MNKIKDIINLFASVLSIVAIVISCYNYFAIDRIQQHLVDIKPLMLEISITKPEEMAKLSGSVINIEGQITMGNITDNPNNDVCIGLAQRKIDIVPLVRPLSETNLWYAQTKPAINRNGHFDSSVNLGDNKGHGIGIDFQILVLAVPKGSINQGMIFRDLPPYGNASRMITVRRIK